MSGRGWTLEAIATPGHTSNHLCFALPEARALFSGDHVMGWSTSVVVPPDGDMGAYLASLEKLLARDDAIYFPAHGDPVTKPQRLVRGMIGHRRQRENQIVRLLGEAPRSIAAMVAAMYVGLDPRLTKAAGASVHRASDRPAGARADRDGRGGAGRDLFAASLGRPALDRRNRCLKVLLGSVLAFLLIVGGIALLGRQALDRFWSPAPPETIATASLQGLQAENRLTALVATYVAVVTSRQQRFGLSAQRTLIMPGRVRYEVDLAQLEPDAVTWHGDSHTLDVVLPPLLLEGPEVDPSRMRAYDGGGLLLHLTDSREALDASNRKAAEAELIRQAREAVPMGIARPRRGRR